MTDQAKQNELALETIVQQSAAFGKNAQSFLAQIKTSAVNEKEREILKVYVGIMEVLEKVVDGELIIINKSVLVPPTEPELTVEEQPKEKAE